jgi:ABC-2 type transport system permease protein
MRGIIRIIRLYFIQAWFSYRSLFAWSTPFNYFANKLGFPFFSMLVFVFMAKFAGFTDPAYIVIGNILLLPALNGVSGISMTIGGERQFGAMSYLLASPAPRAPLFLGRAFFHILDGFVTLIVALPIAMLVLHIDIAAMNPLKLFFCMIILCITTNGIGFIMGTITLLSRDGWMITSTLSIAFYILIGVNFPVELLPPALQYVSYGLPMTRGIMAARLALTGANFTSLAPLLGGEILIGIIYMVIGYVLFRMAEKASMKTGLLDNI